MTFRTAVTFDGIASQSFYVQSQTRSYSTEAATRYQVSAEAQGHRSLYQKARPRFKTQLP